MNYALYKMLIVHQTYMYKPTIKARGGTTLGNITCSTHNDKSYTHTVDP